jgi:hypothetical protein
MTTEGYPEEFETEESLDDFMTEPSDALVASFAGLSGTMIILGIGGKMGHTLGRQAVRAASKAGATVRVLGVSRFSDPELRSRIEAGGIETVSCDLLDRTAVSKLPDADRVVFMAGRKFGTQGNESLTWAMNTMVPVNVVDRYRGSRIVAFSTGCVYPFVGLDSGGSVETDRTDPTGEYAASCLGRERIFEYASDNYGTSVSLIRLNYAIDLRYGVLHDIGTAVFEGRSVDLSSPAFNAIWQGDATDQILRTFDSCASPSTIFNITGPETISARATALAFGRLFDVEVEFTGEASTQALLSNATNALSLFGYPRIPLGTMIRWTADWIKNSGRSLGKPTHFESTDGTF